MQKSIKEFVEQIFSINPTVSTVFGSSLTVGSRDMSGGGISNSANDVVLKLRTETATFAKIASSSTASRTEIKDKAKVIEGYLLNLQILGQISNEFCDTLINDLGNIVN